MRLRALPDDDDVLVPAVEASLDPLLAGAVDPDSLLAEPIGQLRAQIAGVRRADGAPARLIAIAGIDAPEEAALIAAALAVSTARAGYQTLLVDACLDRPTLHALVGCGNAAGLTSFMSARLPGEAIQPTGEAHLSLLSSGPRVPGDEAMLDEARLFGKLRVLVDRFSTILVLSDGDPGLLARTSEGFDGTVLVVRRDVSSTRQLKAATEALTERRARLIGVVCVD